MIRRVDDASFLNEVANHPEVRPHLGGVGEIDLTDPVADEANFALVLDRGGFLYVHLGGFVFEVHSMFLPGVNAIAAARAGLDYMFTRTECLEVMTKVPAPNQAALGLVRACGFDRRYVRRGGWADGQDFTVYGLTLDRWSQASAACLASGRAFHDLIETALGHENHPDDDAHDQAAGAAALMFKAGKATKAAWSYNKWALVAGYELICPEGDDRMNIGNAIVGLRAGELEVLECL